MIIALLIALAAAGPLADGIKGQTWGAAFDAGNPPESDCRADVRDPEKPAWHCSAKFADLPARSVYLYDRVVGLAIVGVSVSPGACTALREAALARFGAGRAKYPGVLTTHEWRDGEVAAILDPSPDCTLTAVHTGRSAAGERRRTSLPGAGGGL